MKFLVKFANSNIKLNKGINTFMRSVKSASFSTSLHVDEKDDKFFQKIKDWWDPNGSMNTLHYYNDLRIKFLKEELKKEGVLRTENAGDNTNSLPFNSIKILDVGCGGGLFCESLARLGGKVVGIDSNANSHEIASGHLESYKGNEKTFMQDRLSYFLGSIDNYKTHTNNTQKFDLVSAMEVIEHVNSPECFISDLVDFLNPGGYLYMSTINKTNLSYLTAILLAERLTGIIPDGTHDWNKFIPPDELVRMLRSAGCTVRSISGVFYNPITGNMSLVSDTSINYILLARKIT